ncbi:MAG TPA: calcium-binding protein [Allosphingosinicella sp.]|nr:calcium-binding protein [Allosphingosinicella sp.]
MPTINGTANDDVLIGTVDHDDIHGLGGNDVIDGGGGGDDMYGGEGDDIYVVRHLNDFIVEFNNQGADIVYSAISYSMGVFSNARSIEVLSTIQHNDTTPINLTSFADTHTIIGNYGNNILAGASSFYYGLLGDDTFFVGPGSSLQIIENEGEGNDTASVSGSGMYTLNAGASVETITARDVDGTQGVWLVGNELTQTIIGNKGDNSLDGGSGGNDILIGGDGNDTYHMHRTGPQIVETAGGGVADSVVAYVDFVLAPAANIEFLIAAPGTAPISLVGNEQANRVVGNDGNNVIDGGAGADDLLQGNFGDDTYRVRNPGDFVQEFAGRGTDIIYVHFSYVLPTTEEIENLSAADHIGTESLNFSGNNLDNLIIGNYGANQLDGGFGGNDTLYGLAGNDTYIIRNAGDQAVEQVGHGSDTVYAYASFALGAGSEVEVLSTVSHAATDAINLTGNEFAQTVVGNSGANLLDGKGGNDLLAGLGGADTFAFTSALGAGNVDSIFDFSAADDTIALDDAVFTGLTPGALPMGAFVTGPAAQDLDDRIIYNQATGQLFYDADGSGAGAAVHFATLSGTPILTAADFMVI